MTFEQFVASAQPITDALWADILDNYSVDEIPGREAFTQYGEGYVLHVEDGGFWPQAWWYRPVRYDTIGQAEAVLWAWRKEFDRPALIIE